MASSYSSKLPYARKYRPSSLVGYIGNKKVKEQSIARINSDRKPQVVLLIGESGCGKTTFARILAKEYLCEDRDEVSGACGVCHTCKLVDEYIATGNTDDLDRVKEINIADNNSKKDVQAFLADVDIPIFGGGWKIYIFDEFHMALESTQNLVLKLFEEPPENVLFIMCTTNPERIIPTVTNRAQLKLVVKKPDINELGGLLRDVCMQENKAFDTKGLSLIASKSELVIRDSLNSLEQVIIQKGDAKYESVLSVFDSVSDSDMFAFFKRLLANDITGYVNLVYEIKTKIGVDSFVTNLLSFVKRGVYILSNREVEGLTTNELKMYKDLFTQFSVEQIKNIIIKLIDMQGSDAEIKLLLMAYTGLSDSNNSQETDVSDINFLDKEVEGEHKSNTENSIERMKPDEEKVESKVADLSESCDVDFIFSTFGGSIVK